MVVTFVGMAFVGMAFVVVIPVVVTFVVMVFMGMCMVVMMAKFIGFLMAAAGSAKQHRRAKHKHVSDFHCKRVDLVEPQS